MLHNVQMLEQADEGHGLMRVEEENEKLGAEISFSSESEVKVSDSGHQSTDIFKKPQFVIGPRRGKIVGKVRNIDTKPQEQPTETEDTGNVSGPDFSESDTAKTCPDIVKTSETKLSSSVSPAQEIKEKSIPLPYKEPKWSGTPSEAYGFEVLKSGQILEHIELNTKSFYVFGRLSTCDISMAHPTVSRYHAVLQYRSQESESNPVGFYIYDLGSTHGTFLNKNRIKSNLYVRVQVGHIIKLGLSTRLFLLHGPEQDMEAESELTVTQLKEKRQSELVAREIEELEHQRQKEERKKQEEDQGIDWGMGDDADQESDLTENPFAATANEELYIDDPKKTLRGWFEREGYDLEYDVEERGFGQFLCRVELPIETAKGGTMVAEALVKGKKKQAVVQCALEACRLLDRYGLLRQATHESKKRKAKDWEAEDYYDSDEDTFLDRTGTVEKKRQQRMRAAGKRDPEEVVETYSSLMKKHRDILSQIHDLEIQLQTASENVNKSRLEQDKATDDDEDALDAFMMKLSTAGADRKEVNRIKSQLTVLKQEEVRLRKLVNITRPTDVPEVCPAEEISKSVNLAVRGKKALPLIAARRKPSNKTKRMSFADAVTSPAILDKTEQEEEQEEEEDEENNLRQECRTSVQDDTEAPGLSEQTQEPNDAEHRDKEGKMEMDTLEIDPRHLRTCNQKTKVFGPVMLPLLEQKPETISQMEVTKPQCDDEEKEQEGKKNRNERRIRQRKKKAVQHKADHDPSDPKYSVWIPPEGQTGDGRTKLNEKYGY